MRTEPLRPLLLIRPERPDLLDRFVARLHGAMPVLLDRRGGERRRADGPPRADRRQAERRLLSARAQAEARALGYHLVYDLPRGATGHAGLYALAFCGECERLLDFELPVFVERPRHLSATVRHARGRGTHAVALEALSASGQVLLVREIPARETA